MYLSLIEAVLIVSVACLLYRTVPCPLASKKIPMSNSNAIRWRYLTPVLAQDTGTFYKKIELMTKHFKHKPRNDKVQLHLPKPLRYIWLSYH